MPKPRKVYKHISLDEAYGTVPGGYGGGISVEEAYAKVPPWQVRMQEVATEAGQKIGNVAAEKSYVDEQWRNYARLWAGGRFTGQMAADLYAKDPRRRQPAEISAQVRLMDTLSPEQIAQHEGQFKQQFVERGAYETSWMKFLKRRQRVGFAYSQKLRMENPDLDPEDAEKKTTDYLRMQGFDAEEFEGKLPKIDMAPVDDDSYWWKATKEVVTGLREGIVRGTADLITAGWSLGLAAGEAAAEERHGERLLAAPKDAYAGHEYVTGAPVGQREDNVYRMFRLAHADVIERGAPAPQAETTIGQIAGGVGQAIPQMAVLMSGAGAARGLALSGQTTRALAMRVSAIGTMFALEGTGAYSRYMQLAEEQGIDPHDASATALFGATTYALAASALEYFGPFRALESKIPGIRRRIVAMALMGAVEGGTEYLQAVTQEAIAYGLKMQEWKWEKIQESLQQAAMEGLVGAIVGGGAGGIAFRSPIIERGIGDVIATDPEAASVQAFEIAQGIGESPLPIDDPARMLPSPETVTPEEAYAAPEGVETRIPSEEVFEKQPWEMTAQELSQVEDPEGYALLHGLQPVDAEVSMATRAFEIEAKEHRQIVEQALAEGKPVPAEVLAEYPDLVIPEQRATSNEQLTSDQPLEALDEAALPNTIQPEETSDQTMARVVAGTLTESDEIDLPPEPVETPEEASGIDNLPDGTPEKTFLQGLIELLKTEQGANPLGDTGRMISGGIAGASGEVSLLRGGVHALLLDESASLRTTDAGREAVALLDEAEARHLVMRGGLMPLYDEALAALPRKQRRAVKAWSYAIRDDGQTNWATLIEHPERVQNIPEGMDVVLEAYRTGVLEVLGDAAVAVKIPQLQYDREAEEWVLAPFKRADSDRYLRLYTREGMDLMAFQEGHYLWDSLVAWGKAHPDRNPNLDFSDPKKLRTQLDGAKQSGKTKKAGSLEFVRIFKELPVALKDKNGKWVSIQTRDPRSHYLGAVERQSRRIALWSTATEMLVPRYGKFNEKTGRMEFRQPKMHPEITDVDGLLARLRKDVATQAKNPRRAENAFNTAIDNYERTNYGGYEAEFMTALGESKAGQALAAGYNISMASVLQLAPLFDMTNPLRTSGSVGWRRMFSGYGSALIDMMMHPWKFAAEYQAMGAVIDGHVDWSVHRDTWFSDVFKRNIPQALMAVGRWTEVRGQFTVARMFDRWVQTLNNKGDLRPDQAEFLTKHLRLTSDQIGEISRGEMSQTTRAKVIQTGVKTISGLTESAHRKGAIQNSPMGRVAIPFLSVVNSVSRGAVRHVGDIAGNVKSITEPGATADQRKTAARNLGRSAWRMLSFVAAIAGSGFLQRYLRRGVTGRPLVDPEDPEQWAAILAESMAEGGIFGPYYRFFEAAKYSNTLAEIPTKLIFPIGVIVEVAMAILGEGQYEDSPWDRRMSDLGAKMSPPWKAARNWLARIKYPSRADYKEVRALVRKYNKEVHGVEPKYGMGRKYLYLPIFEAIRDGDREALGEARTAYWTDEATQALDSEDARRRLKSSLDSRRPVNLNEERREAFLERLPETQRNRVLMEEKRFGNLMEKALLPPTDEVEDAIERG